jgi:hypothetical protein
MNLLWFYAVESAYQNMILKGWPANLFKMNTSIATLSVQCGDQTTLYLYLLQVLW